MSWETKTDYCGLAIANKLICKAANENKSGQYLEKLGQNGQIAATKAFGVTASPSNEYAVAANLGSTDLKVKLGKITTVEGVRYALQSVRVSTGAAQEPSVSATSEQVESTTDGHDNYFEEIAIPIDADEVAQILLSAFTLSGTGCELVKCDLDLSCTIGKSTVKGLPVASDPHTGKMVVSASIGQYGSTVPTITASSGWEISSPLTSDDPDADLPTWTVSLSKPLSKTHVTSSSGGSEQS